MYVSELMFKSKIHDIYRYNGEMLLLWHFQEVIVSQEKTITDLLKAVREQHDQLDNQKIKIKNLEEKVDNSLTRFHYILSLKVKPCYL